MNSNGMVLDEETGVPSLMKLLSKQCVNRNEDMITNSAKEFICIHSKAFGDLFFLLNVLG